MNWNQPVEKISPYIVRIETQSGWGTGFLFLYNETRTLCGIATANHVVQSAEEWQQPIRIRHLYSDTVIFLKESERAIIANAQNDLAVIMVAAGELPFPDEVIPLLPPDQPIGIGAEVGWLGYPAIDGSTLCFFSGIISARKEVESAYLIDGVAINGVSGGPVMYCTETHGIQIVGVVSAYRANRASGDTLPGLLVAQDVSQFHNVIKHVRDVDDANRRKQAMEQVEQPPPENPPDKADAAVAP